ncbi:MAG: hypothetical protein M3Z41_10255 [Candidatus Eremiobacteraeota bacterium]|nr:hypothetical protein [Candidatus Eremiobacteraeota bacterium]
MVVQVAAVLSLALLMASPAAKPIPHKMVRVSYTVSIGSPSNRVRSGTVWLQSYSWNGGDKFKIGTIVDGTTTISLSDALSPTLINPLDGNHDNWVVLLQIGSSLWYETQTLNHHTLFSNFVAAVNSLGKAKTSGRTTELVLPAPSKRTITFLNLDGMPVARSTVGVSLHVSDADHCGVEQGPSIGDYRTDPNGRLTITYPPQPLALAIGHFEPKQPGWWYELIVVGSEKSISVRRNFRFPPWSRWQVTVMRPDGRPVAGALVSSYFNAGCGQAGGAEAKTDSSGRASLRVAPALTGWVDVSLDGKHHQLTGHERALLERSGFVEVRLP